MVYLLSVSLLQTKLKTSNARVMYGKANGNGTCREFSAISTDSLIAAAGHVRSLAGNDVAIGTGPASASAAPEPQPQQQAPPPPVASAGAESLYDQPWHGLAADLLQQMDRLLQPVDSPMQREFEPGEQLDDEATEGSGSTSNLTGVSPRAPDAGGGGASSLAPHPQSAFEQFRRRSATSSAGLSSSTSKAMSPLKSSLQPVEEQQREATLTHATAPPSGDHASSPRASQQQQSLTNTPPASSASGSASASASASLSPAAPVLRPRPRMGVTAVTTAANAAAAAEKRVSTNNPSPGALAMQFDASEEPRKLRSFSLHEQQILEDTSALAPAERPHRFAVDDTRAATNDLYDERFDIWQQRVQPHIEEESESFDAFPGAGGIATSNNLSAMHRSVSAYAAMSCTASALASADKVSKPVFNSGPAGFLTPNDDIVLKPGRQFGTQQLPPTNKRYSSVLPRSSVSPHALEGASARTPPTTKPLSAQPISELRSEPDLAGGTSGPADLCAGAGAELQSPRAQSESKSPASLVNTARSQPSPVAANANPNANLSAGFYDCAWDSRRDRIEALVATIGNQPTQSQEQHRSNTQQQQQPAHIQHEHLNGDSSRGGEALSSAPSVAVRADSLDSLNGPDVLVTAAVDVAVAGGCASGSRAPLAPNVVASATPTPTIVPAIAAPTRSPAATLQGSPRDTLATLLIARFDTS